VLFQIDGQQLVIREVLKRKVMGAERTNLQVYKNKGLMPSGPVVVL